MIALKGRLVLANQRLLRRNLLLSNGIFFEQLLIAGQILLGIGQQRLIPRQLGLCLL